MTEGMMRSKMIAAAAAMVCVIAGVALAQTPGGKDMAQETGGTTRSVGAPGFGGPMTIPAQLWRDSAPVEPYFRIPTRVLKPWHDWKKEIDEKYGIQLGVEYHVLYLKASDGIDSESETEAASGIFAMTFGWTLLNRDSDNEGAFFFKLSDRHSFTDAEPMFLGFETGSLLMPGTGYRDFSARVHEFLWQQDLFSKRAGVAFGKLDTPNYFNYHPLMIPWQDFLSLGFVESPTINLPDPAWGVAVNALPHEHVYINGVLSDPRGDLYQHDQFFYGGEDIWDGKFWTSLEIGLTPSFDERFSKKFSIMGWHTDEFVDDKGEGAVSAEAQGIVGTAYWTFDEKYIPVFLFGFSDGNGVNTLAKKHLAAMLGIRFKSHDVWSFGVNWVEPPASSLRDQYTFETYYRFHLTEHLALTPDFQAVYKPSLNEDQDWLYYAGVRARITF